MYSIGELSKSSGVKVPTIRYYEKIGLMAAPDRSEGNQRRYEPGCLNRLTFIKHARDLGFPLDDIRSLLTLNQDTTDSCDAVEDIVERHLQDVQERINKLQKLETELARMLKGHKHCDDHCSVIESLADHSHCLGDH